MVATSAPTRNNGTLTVAVLAKHKGLSTDWLHNELSVHDLPQGGVGVPYYDFDGSEIAVKRRTALKAKDGSYWPKGRPLAAYGSWRVEAARRFGHAYLVEGETDAWTLWHHGLPGLGLPGAGAAKTLVSEHLVGLTTLYVVREPGQGGDTFVSGVAGRLAELGFDGKLYALRMPEGVKDPSDLHIRNTRGFKAALSAAVEAAVPVPLARPGGAKSEAAAPAPAWPDPQPISTDLPPAMPFDCDLLPEALRCFVADVAERMQCPTDFPAVAIMVALAGVVGKKIGIRPKRHDDWLVVPNLWGAVIGRPGIMKTPAIRQPFKFLQRLEIAAKQRHEQEMREYEEKCLVAEIQQKEKKKAIEDAIKKKRDPLEVARQFKIDEPKKPAPKRYIVNDSTVEKLGELLNLNPTGLTVFRDELIGLLRQLDKEGQEGARAFYLEAWDGLGTFTYDRIGRGTIHIESVTVSVLGAIQPTRLLDYLGATLKGGADDDGLMQRFQLLVYPDVARRWRNVDRWPDTDAKQRAWVVFERLDALNPAAIGAEQEEGDDSVPSLHFAPKAQGLFDDWRTKLEEQVRSGDEHPALESHLAKYRSLVPSLALLLHLADGGQDAIGEEATRKAIRWAAYLESHARRVYSIVINSAAIAAKALAKRIEQGELKDGFTLRDLYRKHWAGLSDREAVGQAVDLLLELGWLLVVEEQTGGKTKVRYRIHPKLLTKTAPEASARSANSPADLPSGTNGTAPPSHSHAPEGGAGDDVEVL
jgi:Protein of unknown function (DUF3987)